MSSAITQTGQIGWLFSGLSSKLMAMSLGLDGSVLAASYTDAESSDYYAQAGIAAGDGGFVSLATSYGIINTVMALLTSYVTINQNSYYSYVLTKVDSNSKGCLYSDAAVQGYDFGSFSLSDNAIGDPTVSTDLTAIELLYASMDLSIPADAYNCDGTEAGTDIEVSKTGNPFTR